LMNKADRNSSSARGTLMTQRATLGLKTSTDCVNVSCNIEINEITIESHRSE
jgi:hypothetical protein